MTADTPTNRVDERDWSALTLGAQIQQLEVEGYLVLPDLLDADHIQRLKAQTATLDTVGTDYSERQRGAGDVTFVGGEITQLIAHPATVDFLRTLFGPEVVMMSCVYARSEPGHPGISLHADGQPFGSAIFGYEGSCLFLVRVLYYLDDLTPDVSPFAVVPRSHLCMHEDANPYGRYLSHPEQVMVPAKAGSAVLLNHRCFHGNYPNVGDHAREMLAIAYRPGWAGPIDKVDPRDPAKLAALPADVRALMPDPNMRHWDFEGGNKPDGMTDHAEGMNPSRWERA